MIASVTRIRLKSIFKLPKFIFTSNSIFKQAKNAPGNKGVKARSKGLEFYTLTIWDEERSMMDFMLNGHHKEAMKAVRKFSNDFGSSRWSVTEMPPWDEAFEQLKSKK